MGTSMASALAPGVGVALVTLFDAAGELDAPATADLAIQLVSAGVRSVLVAGTTGEAGALSTAERASLVGAVRDALPADVPVLAGSGAPSARQAVELTRAVLDAGADAVLALSPPGSADPQPYYEQVAEAAGHAAVFAYHFPFMSGPGIPVDVLAGLPVAGVKDSSGDIGRLYDEVETFPGLLYTGAASLTLMAGALHCAGALLAIANLCPELSVQAFDGDADAQRRIVAESSRVASGRLQGLKTAVAARFGTSAMTRMA
jgi:4-hydroxy-tetrahydrodipicolinate synthase